MAGDGFQLKDRSREFMADLTRGAVASMEAIGERRVADARRRIHRVSGNLEESLVSEIEHSGNQVELWVGASVEEGKKGHHAHLVEFGTVSAAAHPFLRPATRGMNKEFKERLAAAVAGLEGKYK